jgi:hypothetical protein
MKRLDYTEINLTQDKISFILSSIIKLKDSCWIWTGAGRPYGVTKINKKFYSVHRLMYVWLTGFQPEVVMHTCDNTRCVNPRHLEAGTYSKNNWDCVRKGRMPRSRLYCNNG